VIDHFNLPVLDLARSRRFFEQALEPLGVRFLMEDGNAVGFGVDTWAFGIVASVPPISRIHVAFRANSRAVVDAFFQSALAAGAKENGLPGDRANYGPNYYAAFVLDPDGHNVEAVFRG